MLGRKPRTFENVKKVITPQGFQDALEARRLAELRTTAKLRLKAQHEREREKPSLQAIHQDGAAASSRQSQGEDSEEDQTAAQGCRLEGGGADSMQIDGSEGEEKHRRQEQREEARLMKLQVRRGERERRKAEKTAERDKHKKEAEMGRLERLRDIERQKSISRDAAEQAREQLSGLESELDAMKDQKAKLVSQLKQVLQLEEAARTRAMAMSTMEEGGVMPSPLQNTLAGGGPPGF